MKLQFRENIQITDDDLKLLDDYQLRNNGEGNGN